MDKRHKVQFSLMVLFFMGSIMFIAGDMFGVALISACGAVVGLAALTLGFVFM